MLLKLISLSLSTYLLTLSKVTCKSMERFRTQQDIDYWMINDVLKRTTSRDVCWLHPLYSLLVYQCLVHRIKFSTALNYLYLMVLFFVISTESFASTSICLGIKASIVEIIVIHSLFSGILLSVEVNSKLTRIVNMFQIFYSFWWTLVSLLAL